MIRKILIAIGLALGLSVPVSFVAQPASAASNDAIAQALVSATLENLGLEELSEELCAGLVGQLSEAIDAGVINASISAQVARLLENPAMMSGLSDVFDEHLGGETSSWKTWALLQTDSNGVRGGDEAGDSDGINKGPRDESLNNSVRGDDSEGSDSSGGKDSNESGRDQPSDSGESSDEDNDDVEDDPEQDDDEFHDDSVDERRAPV